MAAHILSCRKLLSDGPNLTQALNLTFAPLREFPWLVSPGVVLFYGYCRARQQGSGFLSLATRQKRARNSTHLQQCPAQRKRTASYYLMFLKELRSRILFLLVLSYCRGACHLMPFSVANDFPWEPHSGGEVKGRARGGYLLWGST